MDWDALVSKAVEAPFKPKISDALDMSGFEDADPEEAAAPEQIPDYTGPADAFATFGSNEARDSAFSSVPTHPSAKLAALA